MAFMISKETENVQSSEEIENAFRAITQEREYVTRSELYDHLSKDMADYCIGKMQTYRDPRTDEGIPDAYDFMEFTRTLFQNSWRKKKYAIWWVRPSCNFTYLSKSIFFHLCTKILVFNWQLNFEIEKC